ncbi:PH domain-containing protein [Micromonospora sp. NPDC003776]
MDAAGHYGGMGRWERPYSLDIATGFAVPGVVTTAGFAALVVTMSVREGMSPPSLMLLAVWLAGALATVARRAMLGVYVSDGGIRSRSLLRTTTVPWGSVSDIRSGTASLAGLDMGRLAIVIERTDGVSVQTPLQRGDILRPFTFRPELGRLATWPEHYDEILAILQAHLHDAQRRQQTTATDQPADAAAAGTRSTRSSARASRPRAGPDALTADRRRDIHALTRQHQRGALTDAEYAAELAKMTGAD